MDTHTQIQFEKFRGMDTHCHIQMAHYDADREEVIQRTLDAGVGMVCVGVDYATSEQAIALAHKYKGVWASVGLHPNDNLDEHYDQSVYEVLVRDSKVVAVGEIGLDYYRTTNSSSRTIQKNRFREQLALSRLADKPSIIHCREAHEDMILMLDEDTRENGKALRGVIHSFNGDEATAHEYLKRGWYLGLNGIVTFSKSYESMIRSLPLDRILLETDSPYLTPVPKRGKRNEPVNILDVARHIALVRKNNEDEVLHQTTINSQSLFSINVQ